MPLVEEKASETIDEISEVEQSNEALLQFFTPILSKQDIDILRIVLLIKERSNKGESIEAYKDDVTVKYGQTFLNVHGIGSKNKGTIQEALYVLEKEGIQVTKEIE